MGSRLCHLCGVDLDDEEEDFVSFRESDGEIRILIVALNYEYSDDPETVLTCTKDAKAMFRIAKRGGVEDITVVTDKSGIGAANFPTRSAVLKHIKAVGSRCNEGDWFVWFFAGHGVNVPDRTGDEEDGFDQAFVTPDKEGQLTASALLVDDDFAIALDTFVPSGVRILCICDCCHSGTICDIETFPYKHEIYQISAASDTQEAEDTGKGGVLTTALRRSVRSLSLRHGKHEFSMSSVVEECERRAAKLTDEQDVTFQWSGTDPSLMAWPLCFHWWKYISRPLLKANIYDYEEDGDTDEDSADSE